jgi:hypothetical protein
MEKEIKRLQEDINTQQIQLSILQCEVREVKRLVQMALDKYYLLAQFIK